MKRIVERPGASPIERAIRLHLFDSGCGREQGFGKEKPLGASRFRRVAQMVTETLLLVAAGGIGGLLLTFWMRRSLLLRLSPFDIRWTWAEM